VRQLFRRASARRTPDATDADGSPKGKASP
jgi:hypothetical protein